VQVIANGIAPLVPESDNFNRKPIARNARSTFMLLAIRKTILGQKSAWGKSAQASANAISGQYRRASGATVKRLRYCEDIHRKRSSSLTGMLVCPFRLALQGRATKRILKAVRT
jgi:hypothetical protein